MRMRWLATVAAVLSAVLPGLAAAVDAPHDSSFSDGACERCHNLYITSLDGRYNYNDSCTTCHDRPESAVSFAFPWLSSDQAAPGTTGNHHSWTGVADNPRRGARVPTTAALQSTLMDGRIQCVTCHDAHQSATPDPASKHTSLEIGVAANETGNGLGAGGSAQLTLVAAGTTPRAFRVRVESVNGSGGTYVISHNFGLAAPTFTAAQAFTNNTTFALDDPATTVRISAGASVGDYWDFYISFPFLRLSNVADAICVVCHLERAMNDVRARGTDVNYPPNGARTFSHPVGVGLNANGKGNDAVAVLDANGALQSVGDGNTTNDLVLPSSVVRCTTCHAVHNADSNSLTKDAR